MDSGRDVPNAPLGTLRKSGGEKVQRFVQWSAWSLLGAVLAFLFAIDVTFVLQEGRHAARAETGAQLHVSPMSQGSRRGELRTVQATTESMVATTGNSSTSWVEWKRAWLRYHRHILPVAVATFFLSFGLWSLLAVENLAIRPISS